MITSDQLTHPFSISTKFPKELWIEIFKQCGCEKNQEMLNKIASVCKLFRECTWSIKDEKLNMGHFYPIKDSTIIIRLASNNQFIPTTLRSLNVTCLTSLQTITTLVMRNPDLKSIVLEHVYFTDKQIATFLKALSGCENLEKLCIKFKKYSNEKVVIDDPEEFFKSEAWHDSDYLTELLVKSCPKLTHLALDRCRFTDENVYQVLDLPLVSLSITKCDTLSGDFQPETDKIFWTNLTNKPGIHTLEHLDFSNNLNIFCPEQFLSRFSDFKNLKVLILNNSNLATEYDSENPLVEYAFLPKLEQLKTFECLNTTYVAFDEMINLPIDSVENLALDCICYSREENRIKRWITIDEARENYLPLKNYYSLNHLSLTFNKIDDYISRGSQQHFFPLFLEILNEWPQITTFTIISLNHVVTSLYLDIMKLQSIDHLILDKCDLFDPSKDYQDEITQQSFLTLNTSVKTLEIKYATTHLTFDFYTICPEVEKLVFTCHPSELTSQDLNNISQLQKLKTLVFNSEKENEMILTSNLVPYIDDVTHEIAYDFSEITHFIQTSRNENNRQEIEDVLFDDEYEEISSLGKRQRDAILDHEDLHLSKKHKD